MAGPLQDIFEVALQRDFEVVDSHAALGRVEHEADRETAAHRREQLLVRAGGGVGGVEALGLVHLDTCLRM